MTDKMLNNITMIVPVAAGTVGSVWCQSITEYLLDLIMYYPVTMEFDRICKDILGLESNIRFAGLCDDSGEIKYGGQREGVTNLLSPDETKDQICKL